MALDQAREVDGSPPGVMAGAHAVRRLGRADSEFTRLNEKYIHYCLIGLMVSGAVHAAYILLGDGPTSSPYQLRERRIEVIDIPDEIYIPPPPPAVERPQLPEIPAIPQEPVVSDLPVSQETIPETNFDPFAPPQVPPSSAGSEEFMAFDSPPEMVRAVKPEYPELAREVHAEGVVYVQVTIDETGRVVEAVVVNSNTITVLEDAAVEAAKQSLFRPAKQRDVPVKSRITIPVRFKLN
jgi:protein TonB